MSQPFVDWRAVPGREVMAGDVVWEAALDHLQVIRAEMRPGADFPVHSHQQEQIIVVLEGVLEFTVGSSTQLVGNGQVICVPADVLHGGRVHGDGRVVTLEAFHPPRTDFGHGAPPMDLRSPR